MTTNYDNLIGAKLGNYELIELIGRGGMSAVYRAYQPSVDRYVAVKILHDSLALDPKIIARFEREARAIARLEHPHIVPLYDYGQQDDIIYLAIRFLDGGSLAARLSAEQRPSLAETARLLSQLAPALDLAHSQGILHRDIKPSNILFDQRGNPYLADFGIAGLTQATSDITGEGTIGTPAYMSPEQIMGDNVGPQTDLYALGTVIYEIITGRIPFDTENISSLVYKVVSEPPPPASIFRSDLPPAVSDVLAQALAKDPARRFSTAIEFAQAFERAISGVQEASTNLFVGPAPDYTPSRWEDTSPTVTDFPVSRPAAPLKSGTGFPVARPSARPSPTSTRWIVLGGIAVLVVAVLIISSMIGGGLTSPLFTNVLLSALVAVAGGVLAWRVMSSRSRRLTSARVVPPVLQVPPIERRPSEPEPAPADTEAAAIPPVPPVKERKAAPPVRFDTLTEGVMLKHYELRQRLDTGEKNRVYKAYDTHMEKDVAVKVLNLGVLTGDTRRKRFEQEARILRTLYNPHIIPFFDYNDEDDLIYIVMPLLEGGTLKEKLNGQPMPSSHVIRLVKEIGGALDYLHSKSVIHRDLKSGNIMFDDQGNSFIVDFGIAKVQDEGMNLTSAGEMVGTPYYISPEQWIGLPVSPASDQYALGVLVFQMLTGKLPFEGENMFAMLQKHVYESPPLPSSTYTALPPSVDGVLLKALSKKPQDRFDSVRQFAEALEVAFQAPKAVNQTAGHVFISYSRNDHDYTRKLADHIRQNGFPVWIDDNIDYGDRWFKEIETAINASSAVIVVMTPTAHESEWVHKEILIAKSLKKPILPLLLTGQEFGILIDIQYVDVTKKQMPGPDFYVRLKNVLGA